MMGHESPIQLPCLPLTNGRRTCVLVLALLLSLIDTAFSLDQAGDFEELNPLLRPLLDTMWTFLLVKSALTALGLHVLSRTRTRVADGVLVAGAAVFLGIDIYWLLRVS